MYQVLRCFERHGYFQRICCLATIILYIIHGTDITFVSFVDVPVDIDALKKRMKNAKVCVVTWFNIVSGSGSYFFWGNSTKYNITFFTTYD